MLRRFSTNYAIISIVADAIIITGVLFIAELIRPSLSSLPFAANFPAVVHAPVSVYIIFTIEWVGTFFTFAIYDGKKNFRFIDELTNLTFASLIAVIIMAGTLYLSYREVSRLSFLIFTGISYFGLLGWRIISRFFILPVITKKDIQNTIIIGDGKLGAEIYRKFLSNPVTTIKIIGFVNDTQNVSMNHLFLGKIQNITTIIEKYEISNVIISLSIEEQLKVKSLINKLQTYPIQIYVIPDYIQFALYNTDVETIEGVPLLNLRAPSINDYERMVKRIIDLVLTILLLPLLFPIMMLIAVIIWINDGSPILYFQERAGENGKIFKMIKFRTMKDMHQTRQKTENGNLHQVYSHKSPNDPRITGVGKILRHFSLDELPQLFNVLKGEMSLVGPRPELPSLVENYKLWQRARFTVPQGITGWWQVNGRSENPMHRYTEYDLYYIQNYSIWLDFYILLKTIPVVISGRGAF